MASARETVVTIAKAVAEHGGRAFLVGGSVRDDLFSIEPKDFDVEVYGLAPEKLAEIVASFGEVADVGKAFAILKLVVGDVDIDIAVPRKEQKTGEGHRGFAVEADPYLDPREAARRRDFTVNAIAQDPLTGEIIDPFGGVQDVKDRVLRVVDATTFAEDPLRVLRAMQLIARFNLTIDPASFGVMRTMIPTLAEISPERVGDEWRKLLLRSEKPSLGLAFGMDVGAFAVLHPELVRLAETPQEPEWHPEGDVWTHTMMVVDEAARIARREQLDDERTLTVLLGALCHDMGKPAVTATEAGRIRSHGHEDAGVTPTRAFLESLSIHYSTIAEVVGIVRDHMKPYRLWHAECVDGKPVVDGVLRRLAARVSPATLCNLVLVTEADYCGRGPFPVPQAPYAAGEWLLGRGAQLEILRGPAPHVITGGELIDLGFAPGPLFGQIIQLCDDLRDDQAWSHYAIVEALKSVPTSEFGERDANDAIDRLKMSSINTNGARSLLSREE